MHKRMKNTLKIIITFKWWDCISNNVFRALDVPPSRFYLTIFIPSTKFVIYYIDIICFMKLNPYYKFPLCSCILVS